MIYKFKSKPKNLKQFAELLSMDPISLIDANKINNWGYDKNYIIAIREHLLELNAAKLWDVVQTENELKYLVRSANTDEFIKKNKWSYKIKELIIENANFFGAIKVFLSLICLLISHFM